MGITNIFQKIKNLPTTLKNLTLKGVCEDLGQDNDAVIAVLCIAVVKGIARPIFTMMDEKEDYETKKYAAIREGLTEVVAVPSYYFMSKLAKNIIAPAITKHIPKKLHEAAKTVSFISVCITALLIIPALCSLAIKPIMAYMKQKKENEQQDNQEIEKPDTMNPIDKKLLAMLNAPQVQTEMPPVFTTFKPAHSGMKVGG